jgi:WD40 repeat protein
MKIVNSVVRSLTGHRSNCIAMDFHPFGEFFASGSVDTNLKIWDIRRKRCIHTYKGHDRGINVVKFSPDGRWVVSGGDDNVTKVYVCYPLVLSRFPSLKPDANNLCTPCTPWIPPMVILIAFWQLHQH